MLIDNVKRYVTTQAGTKAQRHTGKKTGIEKNKKNFVPLPLCACVVTKIPYLSWKNKKYSLSIACTGSSKIIYP
jgi:hypothetical protein